jgi:hypothetical protein
MTELKQIMITKNLRVQDVAEITGYGRRMVEKFIAGEKNPPKIFLDAVGLEPDRPCTGMMRRAFIALLDELGMTWQQAATALAKHAERLEKMANPNMNMDRRVAISADDVRVLREYSARR